MEYETRLEELRRLRRDALGLGGGKRTLADHALVRRVHFIYQRATRRFRGDLALWSAWLAHCEAAGSARKFSQVRSWTLPLASPEHALAAVSPSHPASLQQCPFCVHVPQDAAAHCQFCSWCV